MMESRFAQVCASCGEQMPMGTKITRDGDGDWVHADGCVQDLDAFLGAPATNPFKQIPGRYKGKRTQVCTVCFLTSCDCGPGSN